MKRGSVFGLTADSAVSHLAGGAGGRWGLDDRDPLDVRGAAPRTLPSGTLRTAQGVAGRWLRCSARTKLWDVGARIAPIDTDGSEGARTRRRLGRLVDA